MEDVSIEQVYDDYKYLNDNVGYLVNEDGYVNYVHGKLLSGEFTRKDFLIWTIEDIYSNSYNIYSDSEIEWLLNNERCQTIIKRYDIYTRHLYKRFKR